MYLDAEQKAALQKKAKEKGTKVAEEIRSAVDAYLAGVTPEELALLDMASRAAAEELESMCRALDATNEKLDAVFAELERLRLAREAAA